MIYESRKAPLQFQVTHEQSMICCSLKDRRCPVATYHAPSIDPAAANACAHVIDGGTASIHPRASDGLRR